MHGSDLSAAQVNKCSVDSVLESPAYLLFYVKQGSFPWFSTLLEKEDKFPLDGSVSLEEQREIALVNKEKTTSSHGQGSSDFCLAGPAEPTLPDLSEQLQRNGNCNTLSDVPEELEEACRLGEISTVTQGPNNCLIGSVDKNGHADGCGAGKMKDVSPRGSLNRTEMKPSACGSLEVDHTVTQGGSPGKNGNNCNLVQLSHKLKDNDCSHRNFSLQGKDDLIPMLSGNQLIVLLIQSVHGSRFDCYFLDKSCFIVDLLVLSCFFLDDIGDCCGAPSSMGMCSSENERVESKSNNELRNDHGTSKGKCK